MENEIYKVLNDIRPDCDFKSQSDFVSSGMLDSLDVVTLVVELERKFDILIDGLDVTPENFSSVENISKLIKKYQRNETSI